MMKNSLDYLICLWSYRIFRHYLCLVTVLGDDFRDISELSLALSISPQSVFVSVFISFFSGVREESLSGKEEIVFMTY